MISTRNRRLITDLSLQIQTIVTATRNLALTVCLLGSEDIKLLRTAVYNALLTFRYESDDEIDDAEDINNMSVDSILTFLEGTTLDVILYAADYIDNKSGITTQLKGRRK